MPVEVRPLGVRCNLACRYCYDSPLRCSGRNSPRYDLDRIRAAIESRGEAFSLFGGEPLLMKEADLEALWALGLERYDDNSLQTNGTLINDNHIRMFRQYRVRVGVSVDGPDELNDLRWAGSLKRTRALTAKTHAAIDRLCREGMPPGLITVLHRQNATREKLPRLVEWMRQLDGQGVKAMRLHVLGAHAERALKRYCLTCAEYLETLRALMELEPRLQSLRFDLFGDMRNMLLGKDRKSTCVWAGCDVFNTRAVYGIRGDGQIANCGSAAHDGVDYVKAECDGFERCLSLYQTPQSGAGCRDCRFFLMCKGYCPGSALDGDWRNRSEFCELWKQLYADLEGQLLEQGETPLSVSPLRPRLERYSLDHWRQGQMPLVESVIRKPAREPAETPPDHAEPPGASPPLRPSPIVPADRYRLVLPDFVRAAWTGANAKALWEDRIRRIVLAWFELEWRSVAEGWRECCVTTVDPAGFDEQSALWDRQGLQAEVMEQQPMTPLVRCSDEPGCWHRVVVGRRTAVARFRDAWERDDFGALGRLLGWPRCCASFCRGLWHDSGWLDTTWPMAAAGARGMRAGACIKVASPWQTNILWRGMGVRPVPHLPCAFTCAESAAWATRYVALGAAAGFGPEMEWLREILSWPVDWSALHGIAEVRTPILKWVVPTDATLTRHRVCRTGSAYPLDGADAPAFPFEGRHRRGRSKAGTPPNVRDAPNARYRDLSLNA